VTACFGPCWRLLCPKREAGEVSEKSGDREERYGSATGNRSCDPLNFANKTGTFLTLLLVELTAFRKSPIFYPSVFAQKLVKFKFVLEEILGQIGTKTGFDTSALPHA